MNRGIESVAAAGNWWRDAVIYHVYVRSFADSNADGVGDLPGVLGRLDYLRGGTTSLDVDAVWLSPFFPSPQADFGYDISDYLAVDPVYGTLDDLTRLIEKCHERGIRVLIDLVFNHTSTAHPWFLESRSSRNNPKRDWYFWRPPAGDGGPPNNWLSAFRNVGNAWTWDSRTAEYYMNSFTAEQADLNMRNPEVRGAVLDIARTWLERGVDGFRLDVVHRLMKDPLLSDNPPELAAAPRHVSHPTLRQHNFDHPDVLDLLAEIRALVDRYGAVTVGEVPIHDHRRLARYYGIQRPGLHMVFTFGLWDLPWEAAAFRGEVESIENALPEAGWPCYALANHDIPRVTDRYDDAGQGDARARVAAVFLLTARGTPCIYQGEEIGLKPPLALSAATGPDVDGRDRSRTPMQWDADGTGFSRISPWLPFGVDVEHRNVTFQAGRADSILALYRRLIGLRKQSPALRRGRYQTATAPAGAYAYWRTHPAERLFIALNFTAREQEMDCGAERVRPMLSTLDPTPRVRAGHFVLRPHEAVIVRCEGDRG